MCQALYFMLVPESQHGNCSQQGPQLLFACDRCPVQGLMHGASPNWPEDQVMRASIIGMYYVHTSYAPRHAGPKYESKSRPGVPSSAGRALGKVGTKTQSKTVKAKTGI